MSCFVVFCVCVESLMSQGVEFEPIWLPSVATKVVRPVGFEPPALPVLGSANTGCFSRGSFFSPDNRFTNVRNAYLRLNSSGQSRGCSQFNSRCSHQLTHTHAKIDVYRRFKLRRQQVSNKECICFRVREYLEPLLIWMVFDMTSLIGQMNCVLFGATE